MSDMLRWGAIVALLVALPGCSAHARSDSPTRGDCLPRVRYHGVTYVTNTRINQHADFGARQGHGSVIDCDGRPIEPAPVRQVLGVPLDTAVAVDSSEYHGVYVSVKVPADSYPAPVRVYRGAHPLTQRQVDQATAAARREEEESGRHVTGATAIEKDGVVTQSNTGHLCTSGRIVEVTLFGSFNIATGGRFYPNGHGPADDGVTSVIIDLDGATGRPCLIGVATGPPSAEPGSELLFGAAP